MATRFPSLAQSQLHRLGLKEMSQICLKDNACRLKLDLEFYIRMFLFMYSQIPDDDMEKTQPCFELKSYLEIAYTCVRGKQIIST